MQTSRGAAALETELSELQTRQAGVLERLRARRVIDPQLLAEADDSFARLPEYTAKVTRLRSAMDALSARTASMRQQLGEG